MSRISDGRSLQDKPAMNTNLQQQFASPPLGAQEVAGYLCREDGTPFTEQELVDKILHTFGPLPLSPPPTLLTPPPDETTSTTEPPTTHHQFENPALCPNKEAPSSHPQAPQFTPAEPDNSDLALSFQPQIMKHYTANRRAWLKRHRALLVADGQARARARRCQRSARDRPVPTTTQSPHGTITGSGRPLVPRPSPLAARIRTSNRCQITALLCAHYSTDPGASRDSLLISIDFTNGPFRQGFAREQSWSK